MIDYDPDDAKTSWPDGEYDAVLLKVEETTSKKTGNPMEIWTVRVYGAGGVEQLIKDYVVAPGATFKIKQLAEAIGQRADFEARRFQAERYIGANLRVQLATEKQEGFDEKNKIARYKKSEGDSTVASQSAAIKNRPKATSPFEGAPQTFQESEIPF